MSAQENKALVRRWYEEVQVGGRFELVPEFLAAEYVRHEPWGTRTVSPEVYTQELAGIRKRQGQPEVTHDLVAKDDKVAGLFDMRFPSGDRFPTVQIYRVADGKLAETWWGWPAAENVHWD